MKHKLVNWSNMMMVDPMHFKQTEDFFIELVSDSVATGLDRHGYGLLPPDNSEKNAAKIDILEKVTGNVEIRLHRCNAITAGGYLIRFEQDGENSITNTHSFNSSEDSSAWDIILSVNPYKRVLSGIPDEREDPPRHPDVEPTIELYIMSSGTMNVDKLNKQQLVIGKICKQGERYKIDTDYIPPCTCMMSHPALVQYFNKFSSLMDNLETASKEIIAKVRNKDTPSPLALNIEMICRNLMRYISTVYFAFRNNGIYWKPIDITECFSSLAHIFYVSFSFISVTEKEELLNYFYEWNEISPGTLDTVLSGVLEMQYDHNNINESMKLIDDTFNLIAELWIKLSLLEYIGQHKDNIIVSDKKLITQPVKKSKWDIFG